MLSWRFKPARLPSYWVGTPNVPGGVARLMITDNFGWAVDLPSAQWSVSFANAEH
ncbi:hypothetical protein [Variovorax ginsengisoli]|uniref:Uncharacterized protein n=1 Tax=Variovorax ginsengisoli TaxID=363844 RepID=A0ABT9S7Z5_9BURK|nr:hypothetical protein [Variovorax ginsengisoli]MDP9900034.1 hypothetical protein [Variovorax ginsengisoli]